MSALAGGGSQRFFFIQGLVHGNNELGERMEPGEPRVAHEEFEKMVGGLNRADRLLVTHAVVINKGLVEVHEGVTDFGEARSIAGGMARVGRHFLSCAVSLCDRARRNKPFSLPHLHCKTRARRLRPPTSCTVPPFVWFVKEAGDALYLPREQARMDCDLSGHQGSDSKSVCLPVGRLTLRDKASIFARNSFLMSLTQTRTWPQKTIIY
jgi:hypothetical protein